MIDGYGYSEKQRMTLLRRSEVLFRRLLLLVVVLVLAASCGGESGAGDAMPVEVPTPTSAEDTKTTVNGKLSVEPEEDSTQQHSEQKEAEPPIGKSTESPPTTVEEPEEEPAPETGTEEEASTEESAPTTAPEVAEEVVEEPAQPEGETVEDTGSDTTAALDVRKVVYEGIDSEDKCLVAGGTWADDQCVAILSDDPEVIGVLAYWHPALMDNAYDAVDPEAVAADRSERLDTGGPWGIYNYHFFYHYNDLEGEQIQYPIMREAASYAVRWVFIPLTNWVWFPHRYDISWTDDPNIVAITGTYPLGDQRTLLLHTDPEQRSGRPDIELPLPPPPPIRPTTPFLEPQWPEAAEGLGRDCPPVEEVWGGYGTEVTDPCTLKAVETAVDWMWRGDVEWRQLVIRDGHALADFLQEIEDTHEVEGAYYKAIYGEESRVNGWIYISDVKWVGYWPGASMIHLEWNLRYPQREFTPEENEARFLFHNTLVKRGYRVPDKYLSDELTLDKVTRGWSRALVVRTADGTWRMSQRSFCSWYERKIMINRPKLLCPDDPNPHFPDSHRSDAGIHPPSHKNYYQDSLGNPRSTGQYLGIPPS